MKCNRCEFEECQEYGSCEFGAKCWMNYFKTMVENDG